jgi:hypothetical protein
MVFPASFAVKHLMGPQLEHAMLTGKHLIALDKYLRPPVTFLFANFTFHDGLLYRRRPSASNPEITNWPQEGDNNPLMARFKLCPQAIFFVSKLLRP